MKLIISAILASLLVICLLGIRPSVAPVRAEEGMRYYLYLPQIRRQIPINGNSDKLAIGIRHGCAITPAGGVKCWGLDDWGQLGNGGGLDPPGTYAVVGLNARVTAVSAGDAHTCALTVNGGVKCWGNNDFGQLGDGTTIDRYAPVDVVGLTSGVKAISAGTSHTCALTERGSLLCWGENSWGQLGDGTTTDRLTPVSVTVLTSGVQAINTGLTTSNCALTDAGGIKCWGIVFGGTGDGTYVIVPNAVDIDGLTSGVLALAGGDNRCAITNANQFKCWTFIWTKVADGQWSYRIETTEVPGITNVMSGSVFGDGSQRRYCILIANSSATATGGAKCWGANDYGEVGTGTTDFFQFTPADVVGLTSGVVDLDTTFEYSCALLASGGVKCWGYNHFYQLGTGYNTPDSSPVPLDVANFP